MHKGILLYIIELLDALLSSLVSLALVYIVKRELVQKFYWDFDTMQ